MSALNLAAAPKQSALADPYGQQQARADGSRLASKCAPQFAKRRRAQGTLGGAEAS